MLKTMDCYLGSAKMLVPLTFVDLSMELYSGLHLVPDLET